MCGDLLSVKTFPVFPLFHSLPDIHRNGERGLSRKTPRRVLRYALTCTLARSRPLPSEAPTRRPSDRHQAGGEIAFLYPDSEPSPTLGCSTRENDGG